MRLRSVHPGVTVDEIVEATGFELVIPDDVPESRLPEPAELAQIHRLDPQDLRLREVPEPVTDPIVRRPLCDPGMRVVRRRATRSCRPAWGGCPARS